MHVPFFSSLKSGPTKNQSTKKATSFDVALLFDPDHRETEEQLVGKKEFMHL